MRTIAILFAVACSGGKPTEVSNTSPPAPPPPAPSGPYGGATYAGHRFDHTAQLQVLHDQIAPLAGPATANRRTLACAASPKLASMAKTLATQPRPAGTDDRWDGEAAELAAITEDMGPNCTHGDPGQIDFDIDSMHRSFLRLMKLVPKG